MQDLTQDKLKEFLRYDPETGVFRWRMTVSTRVSAGAIAGTSLHGYIYIKILGVQRPAHIWAWLYMTGEYPSLEIDHINRDRADNRWVNLRLATKSQNQMNSGDRSEYRNIRKTNSGKYVVTIKRTVSTLEEAIALSQALRARLHGEYARDI